MTNATPKTATPAIDHAAPKGGDGLDAVLAGLTEQANHTVQSWVQSGNGLIEEAAALTEEILAFSRARLEADLDAWKIMAACRTPAELIECQQRFSEIAVRHYADEVGRLSGRVFGLMTRMAAPIQQAHATHHGRKAV